VDGVCLTATALMEHRFAVGVSPETLRRTNLGDRRAGDALNLERAVLAGSRIGGHYVQGHVDQIGTIRERSNDGPALKLVIEAPAELLPYIVEKGFIAIDGISLTVTGRGPDWFSIMLIPFTQQVVTLAGKPVGSTVNLEVDVMAKYVESLLEGRFDRKN
jgi:riboflavin synthase